MYRNTYVEINLDNMYNNVKSLVKSYSDYKYYIGVVKSNAYGHGSYCAKTMIKAGINYLAVSNLQEAKNIRMYNKDIPILCLEPINVKFIEEAIENNITITVSNLKYLNDLEKNVNNKNLKIHMKINTGMNRLGFKDYNEVLEAHNKINEIYNLEGIFSHFHTTGFKDKNYDNQIKEFKKLTQLIDLSKIKIVHLGKSASLINHKKIDFCTGIRLGIVLYGIDVSLKKPSTAIDKIKYKLKTKASEVSKVEYGCKANLKQSFSLYSEIIEIQHVNRYDYVGYGTIYKAPSDMLVAVLSIGYSDGIKFKDTNRKVYINGKYYETVSSVCAGMIFVKVDNTVKTGDLVEIFGEHINIKQVARNAGTNVYDTMISIHESIPRVYTENGKEVFIEKWEITK